VSVDQPTTSSKTPHRSFSASWKCSRTDSTVPLDVLQTPDPFSLTLDSHRVSLLAAVRRCVPAGRWVGYVNTVNELTGGDNRQLSDKIMTLYYIGYQVKKGRTYVYGNTYFSKAFFRLP
jgi:hypothetical protein